MLLLFVLLVSLLASFHYMPKIAHQCRLMECVNVIKLVEWSVTFDWLNQSRKDLVTIFYISAEFTSTSTISC